MKVDCHICGTSFKRKPKDVKGRVHLYCSRKCMYEGQKADRPKHQPISGVYIIINILNFKMYCGSSTDIVRRIYQHFKESSMDLQILRIHQDISLVGQEFFHFFILEKVEDEKLLRERELWWIKELDADYNTLGKNKPPRLLKTKISRPKKKRKLKREAEGYDEITLEMIRLRKEEGLFLYQIGRLFNIGEVSVCQRISEYNKRIMASRIV